jgi:hypothetical protein
MEVGRGNESLTRSDSMDGKRLLTGAVVGGIAMFALGWVVFDLAFGSFYAANSSLPADAVRDSRILWAWIAGAVALAILVTFAVSWAGASSFADGFKVAAIVGFLVWLGVDLLRYSGVDDLNLTVTLLDPVLEIVRTGLVGGIVAVVLNRATAGDDVS